MAPESDPSLAHYISAANAHPLLSRERELALTQRWLEQQDEAAREELVRAHLRHVVVIALKYRRYGLPLAELIAEGNFGVVHALRKFDTSRGTRFSTYSAYWIRAYILTYIIHSWSMVGGGSGALRSKMFFKLRRERVRIANLVGEGEQADELLAKALDVSRATVASMLQSLDVRDISLDAPTYSDAATTLGDTLATSGPNQEEALVSTEVSGHVQNAVRSALSELDTRERYIIENRLLADNEDEVTLAELGRRLGVSRERARQLEQRAKNKLRSLITQRSRAEGWLDVHSAA